jgi:hypothetical protein
VVGPGEIFYNADCPWTLSQAVYLDFDAPTDPEPVVTHEAGHAVGPGHLGGPNPHQPVAVMTPFYVGGELRGLQPTDLAGPRALSGSKAVP